MRKSNYCYWYSIGNWQVAVFAVSLRDAQDTMKQYRHSQGYKYNGLVPCSFVPDMATGLVTEAQQAANHIALEKFMNEEPEQINFF